MASGCFAIPDNPTLDKLIEELSVAVHWTEGLVSSAGVVAQAVSKVAGEKLREPTALAFLMEEALHRVWELECIYERLATYLEEHPVAEGKAHD